MDFIFSRIEKCYPYNLLLLADETVAAINKYLPYSDVYIAKQQGKIVGVICLLPIDKQTTEIKNIAISPAYQGEGLGSRILKKAEEIARKGGYITIIVGTADCGTQQIQFYEKNGYSKYAIKENFFLENYVQPIYENGIILKDMIMLRKELK